MGQKKDIGELFEQKLSKGKKKPSESVWEKINTSLDAEKLDSSIVTQNYHYYNSRNNKTIVTQDKNEIDSIISSQDKSIDSLSNNKMDRLSE